MSILEKVVSSKRAAPRRTLLYGVHGCGKCLKKGTKVIMYDGSIKKVEDVKVGDLLMGPDSKPRTVVHTTTGIDELFDVIPKKGEKHTVTGNHVLALEKMGARFTGDKRFTMSVSEYVDLPSNSSKRARTGLWKPDRIEFAEAQKPPIDPYFFGVWLGDGSSANTSVTTPEPEIVSCMMEVASSIGDGMRVYKQCERGLASTYAIRRVGSGGCKPNELLSSLRSLGVLNNKHIPHVFRCGSIETRLCLLAGLIDTDGHHNGRGNYEITQKSKQLAYEIAFVARSVGLTAIVKQVRKKCCNTGAIGTYYRMSIFGNTTSIPCRVPRKVATERLINKSNRVVGFDVKPAGIGEYFGFELDGDHLFLLGDFTVSHNSTWSSKWPKPVFVQTEDGIADLDVASFPLATTLQSAWEPVIALGSEEHDFKTIVIDSADWLEKLIWDSVCKKTGKEHISDFGYGKGYAEAAQKLGAYLSSLNDCRNVGMHVIVIAHAAISRFESPEGESYDRYAPKLHRESAAILQEWADEVLFATYKVFTATKQEGFGRERAVGIGTGERIIKTTERPAHNAKNRLGLPDEMSLDFSEYAKFLYPQGVNVNG